MRMTAQRTAPGRPGAPELCRLLDACREPAGPLLESIAGGPVVAEVFAARPYVLPDSARLLLRPGPADTAFRGAGMLRTHRGIPVAETTLTVMPSRMSIEDPGNIPWPDVLREAPSVFRGAVRRPVATRSGTGYLDAAGWPQPVRVTALIESPGTGPAALAETAFYAEFAALAAVRLREVREDT